MSKDFFFLFYYNIIIMESIKNTEIFIKSNLDSLLKNQYIMTILKITLVLYASTFAPKLPSFAQATFSNTFVKILAIALMAYLADVDFQLAIILAVIYVLVINVSSGRNLFESYTNINAPFFSDQTKYTTLLGTPAKIGNATLLNSQSDNYSGCDDIKMNDLLDVFDNDHIKLQTTIMYAYKTLVDQLPEGSTSQDNLISISKAIGLPGNVEFNDTNAPLIATVLLNAGFKISNKCQAPIGDNMINA